MATATPAGPARARRQPALLCLSQSFSPDITPTAIRASKLLEKLSAQWDIAVVTESLGPPRCGGVRVEVVRGRRPTRILAVLRRLRLSKLLEMVLWPDESIFWVLPAILAGRRLIKEIAPSAIVVFMMPYSAGLAGIALSRLTRLPLILNLDDSLTCTDMHPSFPTRLHYLLAKTLEDYYAKRADAIVYVSDTNLDMVKSRQPEHAHQKFHLVRFGADRLDSRQRSVEGGDFQIIYVGALTGWWTLIAQQAQAGRMVSMYRAWASFGRYERTTLDSRTSSPAVIGQAIIDAIGEHPSWTGRVNLDVYGKTYPDSVIARALAAAGVEEVVTVRDSVPHDEVANILGRADLLFLTLPRRVDGSRGGRISAKTYEYLMTDRPILAAVPQGENWDYLADKPGVWLVDPEDRPGMKQVIVELTDAKFAGRPRTFDRNYLQAQLSYDARASEFATVVRTGIERRLSESNALP